jgi:hypothetical protein
MKSGMDSDITAQFGRAWYTRWNTKALETAEKRAISAVSNPGVPPMGGVKVKSYTPPKIHNALRPG